MATEKIDIHNTDRTYKRILQRVERELNKHNADLIRSFIEDSKIGLKGAKTGKRRLHRYIWDLLYICRYFNGKDFDKIENGEYKQFYIDLDNDKIKKENGKPYAIWSKIDFIRSLKKFYKWMLGDTDKFKELVGWMRKDFGRIPDPPKALKREDIEKLADNSKLKQKALIWFMFDAGARAEELLNIRLKHIIEEKDKDYLKIRIEFSKTLPRTITIPMASQYVKSWLQQHPDKNNEEAFLFPITYAGLYKYLIELGQKVIKRPVNPHLMRHSSATFYAQKIKNPYKLNYRYGWATASDMSQVYIDREGLMEEETAEIVKIDEVMQLKKEIEALKEDMGIRKGADQIMNILMEDEDFKGFLRKKAIEKDLVDKIRVTV